MKTEQLQIRLSSAQKAALKRRAAQAGRRLSTYVLELVAPEAGLRFEELLDALAKGDSTRFTLAALNDLLSELRPAEFETATRAAPPPALSARLANQVPAMVEFAAAGKGVSAPAWTRDVRPLEHPWFATDLPGLRLHLLIASPAAFRRRNLFVDATIGDRVQPWSRCRVRALRRVRRANQ